MEQQQQQQQQQPAAGTPSTSSSSTTLRRLLDELATPVPNLTQIREICLNNPGVVASQPSCRLKVWSLLLLGKEDILAIGTSSSSSSSSDDEVPSVSLDLPIPCREQQVLEADVKRTRADYESFRSSEHRRSFTAVLQNFCLKHDIQYKQGMNEVLAPFFFLCPPPMSNFLPYSLFEAFLFRYLERYFCLDDSSYLFKSFRMFHTLLLYHDPQLAMHLDTHHFSPEFYSPQWFLTLFARGLPLDQVIRLWDVVISVDDPAFSFFIGICLIRRIRSSILLSDSETIPEKLKTGLCFSGESDIDFILSSALVLYRKTPRYFCRLLRMCCVSSPLLFSGSNLNRDDEKKSFSSSSSSNSSNSNSNRSNSNSNSKLHSFANVDQALAKQTVRSCMMLSAQEAISTMLPILNVIIPSSVSVSNPTPEKDQDNSNSNSSNNSSDSSSSLSSSNSMRVVPGVEQQFIFIDIRSAQESIASGAGSIPKTLQLEPEFVDQPDALDVWIQHFDSTKGASICIIDLPPGHVSGVSLWRRLLLGEGDGFASSSIGLPTNSSSSPSSFYTPRSRAPGAVMRDMDSKHIDVEDLCIAEDLIRPAVKLAKALHNASFPNVSVLEGGFPALIQVLQQSRGTVEPIVINHDPEKWANFLRVTGRSIYLSDRSAFDNDRSRNGRDGKSDDDDDDNSNGKSMLNSSVPSEFEQMSTALRIAKLYGHETASKVISEKMENLNKQQLVHGS